MRRTSGSGEPPVPTPVGRILPTFFPVPSLKHKISRIAGSRAARNAGASYIAFISTSLYSLVSIPLAVSFLGKEEIGLWLIVNGIVGYLIWMDVGIGDATGRKIADAVAAGDHVETNRWWTTSMVVLVILGALTALATLAIAPFLPRLLNIAEAQRADANWLFIGGGLVAALATPIRAYPGLLLAQHRFHWVSLVQAIIPWVQLVTFFVFLKCGYGVRSYLPSLAISQACGWLIFIRQVHGQGGGFKFDRTGLEKERIRSLFAYGGSVAALGLAGAVLYSLPAMILARAGGLALVPVFAFTARGVSMFAQLSQRTTHAFYPGMQRMFVAGKTGEFRERFREVLMVTVGIGLATAGFTLVLNPTLISWLAKPDYYAGLWTNVWFAIGLIVAGVTGGFSSLLQISGSMGRMAIVAALQLVLGSIAGWFGYQYFGLPGLAATFAVVPPFCKGLYGLIRGARNCGYSIMDIGGKAIIFSTGACLLVLLGGLFVDHRALPPAASFMLAGRLLILPSWLDLTVGIVLMLLGGLLTLKHFMNLGRNLSGTNPHSVPTGNRESADS
jgi:O-antigen/teichoic acid export membrane protein